MRAADEAVISAGTEAAVLMERAGRAVVRAVVRRLGGRYGRRVTVVCGRGSNGGDGFVAARLLARAGVSVTCLGVAGAAESSGAAGAALERMVAAGVPLRPLEAAGLEGSDAIVDALFGTGFRGRARDEAEKAIAAVNAAGRNATVVAVDVPSGVDGATGAVEGPVVAAHATVAMGAEKLGTAVSPGARCAGEVEVADIGIPVTGSMAAMVEPGDVVGVLPRRSPDAHKRSGGSVAVLAGSNDVTGAAVLTARGAARMGAGYVTVGSTTAVRRVVATKCPEALIETATEDDVLGPAALERLATVLERADALAVGPGLGRGEPQGRLLDAIVSGVELPVVIDADGLNALAGRAAKPLPRRGPTVLTPHPAELARLLDREVAEISSDRPGAARAAAEQFGAVVLLKGWRTVVADPGGRLAVIPTGGPELATAGTGDVLTGAAAALAAAGIEAWEAAWAAAYVHGVAGSLAARANGPSGVVAWDVAEALPAAFRAAAGRG
jgi:hydroxyethylthiazole kinase-like uncharacterized protein yjeF